MDFKERRKRRRRIKMAYKDNTRRNIEILQNGYTDIGVVQEVYPCDKLLLTIVFNKDATHTIVDFSQYEEKSLIHYICYTEDEPDFIFESCGKDEMASRMIETGGVVYRRSGFKGGKETWTVWNYAF